MQHSAGAFFLAGNIETRYTVHLCRSLPGTRRNRGWRGTTRKQISKKDPWMRLP